MIVILFSPGTFGSMVEYSIRNFTKEFEGTNTKNPIKENGSVHTFYTINQAGNKKALIDALNGNYKFITPIYPMIDFSTTEVLNEVIKSNKKTILIKVNDKRWAEINNLFRWYKIYIGENKNYCISGDKQEIIYHVSAWNPNYKTFKDMELWEYREFISLFYDGADNELIIDETVNLFSITNKQIIENTYESVKKIINYSNFTINDDDGLKQFTKIWREKQQYIIDEYETIEKIVQSIINKTNYKWNKISLFGEAIVQKKLRDNGWEIECYGLNDFPTDTISLLKILVK